MQLSYLFIKSFPIKVFLSLYIFILQLWRLMNLYFDKKCHNCTKKSIKHDILI